MPCSIAKSEPSYFQKCTFFCQPPSSFHLERSSGLAFNLSFIHSFIHSFFHACTHAFPLIYGAPTMHQTLLLTGVTSKNITVSIALLTNNWDWHFRTLSAALNSFPTLVFLLERMWKYLGLCKCLTPGGFCCNCFLMACERLHKIYA